MHNVDEVVTDCSTCNGLGSVTQERDGSHSVQRTCSACKGSGMCGEKPLNAEEQLLHETILCVIDDGDPNTPRTGAGCIRD